MDKVILSTVVLSALIGATYFITTGRTKTARNVALLFLGLLVILLLTGCAGMLQTKQPFIHRGYVCYTNAAVIEVKNVREQLKFVGPAVKPEKKKLCDVVIKTDQGKKMTTAQEGDVECSTETVNQRRMIYVHNDQIIGMSHEPDPFLEEQDKAKK